MASEDFCRNRAPSSNAILRCRPGLISDLVTLIDGLLQQRYISMIQDPHDTLRLRRSLRLLKCIVKELSSIKLLNGIRAMAQVIPYWKLFTDFLLRRISDCGAIENTFEELLRDYVQYIFSWEHQYRQFGVSEHV